MVRRIGTEERFSARTLAYYSGFSPLLLVLVVGHLRDGRPSIEYSQWEPDIDAHKLYLITWSPHSAEGLTEKRISSKVRKNVEGPKSVTRSGVPNRASGSFGDRGWS